MFYWIDLLETDYIYYVDNDYPLPSGFKIKSLCNNKSTILVYMVKGWLWYSLFLKWITCQKEEEMEQEFTNIYYKN